MSSSATLKCDVDFRKAQLLIWRKMFLCHLESSCRVFTDMSASFTGNRSSVLANKIIISSTMYHNNQQLFHRWSRNTHCSQWHISWHHWGFSNKFQSNYHQIPATTHQLVGEYTYLPHDQLADGCQLVSRHLADQKKKRLLLSKQCCE